MPRVGGLCLVGAALVQELSPVYNFPQPRPFAGSRFYNPYAAADGRWLTSNFHAHAHAWAGLTNGTQSADAVRHQYRAMGYSIIAVSDYQHVTLGPSGDPSYIPVYEHGYNIPKTHQLAIGARRVVWGDFVLWQSRHHKQLVIDELKSSAELVAIAHPELRGGYSAEDFRYLTNYDLLEIASHYGIAVPDWDVALSNGHPIWAIGSDDSHDATDPRQTGSTWTMIGSDDRDSASVVSAMRDGRMYVVKGHYGVSDVVLQSLALHGDTLIVRASAPVERIDFVGQGGHHLASVANSSEGRYILKAGDTYVRTVLTASRMKMYLNPVLRYDGTHLPHPATTVNAGLTWLMRLSTFLTLIAAALLVLFGGRKERAARRRARPRTDRVRRPVPAYAAYGYEPREAMPVEEPVG